MKIFTITLLVLFLGTISANELTILVSKTVMRKNKSMWSKKITILHRGDKVNQLKKKGSWFFVSHSGKKGWVHKSAIASKKFTLTRRRYKEVKNKGKDEVALGTRGFANIPGLIIKSKDLSYEEYVITTNGFNRQVEKEYLKQNPKLKPSYKLLDKIEEDFSIPEFGRKVFYTTSNFKYNGNLQSLEVDPNATSFTDDMGLLPHQAKLAEILDRLQQYYLGRAVAAHVLSESSVCRDRKLILYANMVLQMVARSSDEIPEIYSGYHLVVLNSNDQRIFHVPVGLIFITKGLLKTASSEDELAALLAHQMAHITKKHAIKSLSDVLFRSSYGQELLYKGKEGQKLHAMTKLFATVAEGLLEVVKNPEYEMDLQKEAVRAAISYCANAGYSLEAAKILKEKLPISVNPLETDLMSQMIARYKSVGEVDMARTKRFNKFQRLLNK